MKTNTYVELVEKWLADPDAVTYAELDSNASGAANIYSSSQSAKFCAACSVCGACSAESEAKAYAASAAAAYAAYAVKYESVSGSEDYAAKAASCVNEYHKLTRKH